MSRYLEFIEDSTDRQENVPVLKDIGCRAAAATAAATGGEKAANKLCPRKRITRESRTPRRREKSGKKQCRVLSGL